MVGIGNFWKTVHHFIIRHNYFKHILPKKLGQCKDKELILPTVNAGMVYVACKGI